MAFEVRADREPGVGAEVVVLEGPTCRACVWPAGGFNAYRWQAEFAGQSLDLIYAGAALFEGGKASGHGNPILFPFPNRIRGGRYTWAGKEYRLPHNEPGPGNAIHGFVLDRAWRVVDRGSNEGSAWVTGEFQASRDGADVLALWPADYRLRVTYRLAADSLAVEAVVTNPSERPLPFGLGHHPYFRVPLAAGAGECEVTALADAVWQLQACLPGGERAAVAGAVDLRGGRPLGGLRLDDVYTSLSGPVDARGLRLLGSVRQPGRGVSLRVLASTDFRELVLYTPPHGQAVCLEPYTCMTDAVNLEARGVPAGWRVLPPGGAWAGDMVLELGTAG